MSQNDLVIANQSAPDFRADLNDALQALGSLNSGSTAPSTTYANMLWYDTSNNILKMRSEADDAWINVGYLCQSTNKFCILDDTNVVTTGGTQVGLLGDQAESAWETGTSTTESLVSPAKVKAAVEALTPTVDDPIGVNQSWGVVSLSDGSARQNTTGRPIQASVTVQSFQDGDDPASSNIQVSSDGSNWVTVASTSAASTGFFKVSSTMIIPSNHYYRYNGSLVSAAEMA